MIRMVLRLLHICGELEPSIGCRTNDEIDNIPEEDTL
jgi:hypothetical protein